MPQNGLITMATFLRPKEKEIENIAKKTGEKVLNNKSGKTFGELFLETKNLLDDMQASLAKTLMPLKISMPAAKYGDIGMGIDYHTSIAPPISMTPVPNVVMVYDIIAGIFEGLDTTLPPVPPPNEDEEIPIPIAIAHIGRSIIAMMRPTVKVNGRWIANAGTAVQTLPAVFQHISPLVAPMAEGEIYMGSSTVLADGSPFSYQHLPILSCNLVGIPAPFRPRGMQKPKLSLKAPTVSLTTVIPSGNPVMIGGAPTIDAFALAINLGLKGFAKLWKRSKDAIKAIRKANKVADEVSDETMDFMMRRKRRDKITKEQRPRIITRKELKQYKKEMNAIGVEVVLVKRGKKIPKDKTGKAVGAYDHDTKIIYLKKPPKKYTAMHERIHAEQHNKLGDKEYKAQTRIEKEQHVYDKLMENKHLLTEDEINHADDYLKGVKYEEATRFI